MTPWKETGCHLVEKKGLPFGRISFEDIKFTIEKINEIYRRNNAATLTADTELLIENFPRNDPHIILPPIARTRFDGTQVLFNFFISFIYFLRKWRFLRWLLIFPKKNLIQGYRMADNAHSIPNCNGGHYNILGTKSRIRIYGFELEESI